MRFVRITHKYLGSSTVTAARLPYAFVRTQFTVTNDTYIQLPMSPHIKSHVIFAQVIEACDLRNICGATVRQDRGSVVTFIECSIGGTRACVTVTLLASAEMHHDTVLTR
jgi:hypothetical protein